ncbi:MAG: RrF2 family transcriptional regulator, partial [Cyanobium sp.]
PVFSTTFRYGLICLLELAGSEELLQAGTIAARHQLSQHYLAVVLSDLRRLGLVQSQKGKNGGYRLMRSPREVNLLDLYCSLAGSSLTDEPSPLKSEPTSEQESGQTDVHGRSHPASLVPPSPCRADAWLASVSRRGSAELAATTLADLQGI